MLRFGREAHGTETGIPRRSVAQTKIGNVRERSDIEEVLETKEFDIVAEFGDPGKRRYARGKNYCFIVFTKRFCVFYLKVFLFVSDRLSRHRPR